VLKKKPPTPGAPQWIVTYGDMMTLLLCFFILLAAFADYEEGGAAQRKFDAAIESIQEALGVVSPGGGKRSEPAVAYNALVEQIKTTIRNFQDEKRGDSPEKGMHGKSFRLRRIRDGMEITVGGPLLFEPFSVQLTEEGRTALGEIGDLLRGHRNKVEIRGHAAEEPRPSDWTYDDAMQLSYMRAKHVAEALMLRGADPRAIRLVAVGWNEPVPQQEIGPVDLGQNRRVEIIVRESLIDDYLGQVPLPGPASRPGPTLAPERSEEQPASPGTSPSG
jgi:chemotaxis protein MotB